MKFYPAMIWVVSRVINVHEEFKLGWDQDGNLIRWDFFPPVMPTSTRRTGTSPSCYALHGGPAGIPRPFPGGPGKVPGTPGRGGRAANESLRCVLLPWVRYRHFDVHVFAGGLSGPGGHLGQVRGGGQRLVMPLTMNIHHAVADGFHLSRFFPRCRS